MPIYPSLRRLLAAAVFALACTAAPGLAADPTLFARLGGQPAMDAIADQVVEGSKADPVAGHHFDKVNIKRLKEQLSLHLCSLTGGPCVFDGDDMKTIHAGLNINQAEFYAMVERLRDVLDRRGVAAREKNELLALLAPMKRDVVTQ